MQMLILLSDIYTVPSINSRTTIPKLFILELVILIKLFCQNSNNIKFTWCRNILNKVYSNIKLGFKSTPLPHFDQSDHVSNIYPLKRKSQLTIRTVKVSRCGQKELLCICIITLEGPIETFLINQTWKHIPQLYFKLYNVPALINMSGYILTRNHG